VQFDAAVQCSQAQSVVVEVAEAVFDRLDFLDQQVDRFGRPVGDAAGVEAARSSVRQESMVRASRCSSGMSASAQ
jgi:hypothetical protein